MMDMINYSHTLSFRSIVKIYFNSKILLTDAYKFWQTLDT